MLRSLGAGRLGTAGYDVPEEIAWTERVGRVKMQQRGVFGDTFRDCWHDTAGRDSSGKQQCLKHWQLVLKDGNPTSDAPENKALVDTNDSF